MHRVSSAALVSCLAATSAFAGPIGLTGNPTMTGTDGTHNWAHTLDAAQVINSATGNLSWGSQWAGASPAANSFTVAPLNPGSPMIFGNVDPVLGVAFSVTNNTLVTQNYTFIFSLPIAPAIAPASLTGGSTGLTITDLTGDGVAASDTLPANAFYTALIDGTDYYSIDLLNPALSNPTPFQSATDSDAFGTPIPSLAGPAVNSTIGLRFQFSLTPGDTAGITGNFVVEVPEPTSLALLSLGGLALTRRRRGI